MTVSIWTNNLNDSIAVEDDSIDMQDDLKMTVSIWEMTVSIWKMTTSIWKMTKKMMIVSIWKMPVLILKMTVSIWDILSLYTPPRGAAPPARRTRGAGGLHSSTFQLNSSHFRVIHASTVRLDVSTDRGAI